MVTAVITTYKRKPEIVCRALKSVLNQTYKDLEIFVVDDSPSDYEFRDDVSTAINMYQNVSYIQHEKNLGACEARNTGLWRAKGEYIGFLDDDDTWEPTKIERMVQKFEESSPELGLVYSGCIWIDAKNNSTRSSLPMGYKGYVFDTLLKSNFIGGTSGPLLRTELLKKIGGFDSQMKSAQDADVWLRLAKECMIDYVNEPLYSYYVVHNGEQISTNPKKKLEGIQRIYDKNSDYMDAHKDIKWCFLGKLAPLYMWNGYFRKSLELWGRTIILRPTKVYFNILILLKIIKRFFMYCKQNH